MHHSNRFPITVYTRFLHRFRSKIIRFVRSTVVCRA
jgi:hypothetical protein